MYAYAVNIFFNRIFIIELQTLASPTSRQVVLPSKLVHGKSQFHSPSRLSTQPLGVFRGFLRNLRKAFKARIPQKSHGEHSSSRLGFHMRTISLNPTTQPNPNTCDVSITPPVHIYMPHHKNRKNELIISKILQLY